VAVSIVSSGELSAWANAFSNLTINASYQADDYLVVLIMSNGAFNPPTNGWTQVGSNTVSNSLTLFYRKMAQSDTSFPLTGLSGAGKVSFVVVRGAGNVSAVGNYTGTAQTVNTDPLGNFVITTTGNAGGDGNPYTGSGWTRLNTTSWGASDYYTMAWKQITLGTFNTPTHTLWNNNENYIVFTQMTTALNDKPSSIAVSRPDLQSVINPRYSVDIPSTIDIPAYQYLSSRVDVRSDNTMDGTAFIWGVRDSDRVSTIDVMYTDTSYLRSKIDVRESNIAFGKVVIWGVGASELTSNALIIGQAIYEVGSSIGVRLRNSMTAHTDIVGSDDSDIQSTINAKQVSDLKMSLGVTPSNKMTAIVDIQQPTRVTDTVIANRDLFIREGFPRLNYGGEQTIVTGYSGAKAEIFRSLIGFDIQNIVSLVSDYKIEKVSLKLKHSLGRTPTIPLELRGVTGTWTEYGTTWNNQPESGEVISGDYGVDEEKGFITFDITSFVLNAKEQGITSIDFFLRAVNELDNSVQFFSMDAGVSLAPSIEYTYFDEIIRSTGRSGIDTKILVVYPANKNLTGKIKVYKYPADKDLSSKINVTPSGNRIENYPSSLTVSVPQIKGKGVIQVKAWNNLASKVAIRESNLYDLEKCTIKVSRPSVQSKLYVRFRNDLPSEVGVRVWADDYLYGWAIVNIKERPATIHVRPYIDWKGSITVRRSVDNDLTSFFVVSEVVKVSKIYVLYRKDLTSTITVRGGEDNDIASRIAVSQFQFNSSIKVIPYKDWKGSITVRRSGLKQFDGSIAVSRPDLKSSIKVNGYSLLNGTITVRRSDNRPPITAKLTVSRPQLDLKVYVKYRDDLGSEIVVRRSKYAEIGGRFSISRPDLKGSIFPIIHNDLQGSISVRRRKNEDLNTNIIIPYRKNLPSEINVVGASMLPSSILVNSGYLFSRIEVPAYDNKDLQSKFTVRQKMASDITSSIDVYSFRTLGGRIEVRKSSEKDISGKIVVRHNDLSELPASVDVWITRNLSGKITVRSVGNKDLNSKVYVLFDTTLVSRLHVLNRSDLVSKVKVMFTAKSDIPSKITAKIRVHSDLVTNIDVTKGGDRDLNSSIGVSPSNRMTGIVDVVQAIREHELLTIVKDSYVREDVPTLNYGEETSFAVGNYNGKILRSLLGFDITSLKKSYDIDKVELKLYYGQQPAKALRLLGVDGNWSETGVTWSNAPKFDVEIATTYLENTEEGYVTFDVTQFVLDKYLAGIKAIDFFLVAADESESDYEYFFTRETGATAPKLAVTYYDPAIWSMGRANLDSSVIVPSRNNLTSRLRVKYPAIVLEYLPSSIEVTRNNVLQGAIAVSRPNLTSKIAVVMKGQSELPAQVGVWGKASETIGGTITVSKPDLPIKLYVRNRIDLPSKLGVMGYEEQDFFSWLIVNIKERPATLYVLPHNDIQLSFTVRGKTDEDFPSTLAVARKWIDGTITVQQDEDADLPSEVGVRRDKEDDFTGSITVRRQLYKDLFSKFIVNVKERPATLEVLSRMDLPSSLDVIAREEENTVPSAIVVTRDWFNGSIDIPAKKDMPSKVFVKPVWLEWLTASITVSKPDIEITFYVRNTEDLVSSIHVRGETEEDLAATVGVSRPDVPARVDVTLPSDINASITVKAAATEDLTGQLAVSRQEIVGTVTILGRCDIPAQVAVRLDGETTIESGLAVSRPEVVITVTVRERSDLPSKIAVRLEDKSSVEGGLIVSRPELLMTLTVIPTLDIPSKLMVMHRKNEDLNARVYVKYMHDIVGYLDIIGASMIPSTIRVISGNLASRIAVPAYSDNDLTGIIGVRNRYISEIPATLQVQEWSQIVSTILPKVFGHKDLTVSFVIMANGGSNLPSSIEALNAMQDYLKGRISVLEVNTMDGKADIKGAAVNDLVSYIRPVVNNDIPSTIGVRFDNSMTGRTDFIPVGDSDIESSLAVSPASDIAGSILVYHNGQSDITCSFIIKSNGNSDIPATMNIVYRGNGDLPSEIGVSPTNKMTGKVFIIPVRDADLPSSIEAHHHYNVQGKITVRQFGKKDLNSTIEVHHFYEVAGTIEVRRDAFSNLTSKITVRREGYYDKRGTITVRQRAYSDLNGSINTIQWKVLTSKIVVRRDGFSEIPVQFTIVNSIDLENCTITVRRTEKADLTSTITVRRSAYSDLPNGKIVARQRANSDLPSSLETWQFRTLPSKLVVRRSEVSNLPSSIYVLHHSDLPSTISTRREDKSDLIGSINTIQFKTLPSSITVRRTEVSDLPSDIYVLYRKDLPSSLYVLYRNDIQSTIDVVADYGYCFIM
jgi:hypothetical protein